MNPDHRKGSQKIQEILKQRDRQFETIGQISGLVSRSEVLEKGLEEALDHLRLLVGAGAGTIHLLDPAKGVLVYVAGRGISERFACEEKQISVGECLCGEVAERGRLQASNDLARDRRITRSACKMDRFGSILSIPLRSSGLTLGLFTIYSKQPYGFSEIDHDLLNLLGDQIGSAIENAKRYSRTWEDAVQQERALIAQEIHDSIAQSLAYLNLQARKVEDLLKTGDGKQALSEMASIRQAVKESYQDVRQLMVDFRTGMGEETDLIHAIRCHVQEYSQRTGLRVTVNFDTAEIGLDSKRQVQAFRIIQEALSNVRRHASARSIAVDISAGTDPFRIRIKDDGRGFDTDDLLRPKQFHLGLNIIRERVDRLGGHLDLRSKPGEGTTLEIDLPLPPVPGEA